MDAKQESTGSRDEEESYPPISPGTYVRTTWQNELVAHQWTPEALARRKWDMLGEVVGHSDSHGLCYKVLHADETVGWYDPTELHVFTSKFKVEDRVKIVRVLDKLTNPELVGREGVVEEVAPLSNGDFNYTITGGYYVHEQMLEPVE